MKKPETLAEWCEYCGFDPNDREVFKWWATLGPKERTKLIRMSHPKLGKMRTGNGDELRGETTIKDYYDKRPLTGTEVQSERQSA